MKHVIARSLILGTALSLFPCIGATVTQTDFLKEPQLIQVGGWEPIRTHEMTVEEWWQVGSVDDPDIPNDCEEASHIAGNRYNIVPELFQAMGWHESRYDVNANNNDNYLGWLQVSPKWHASRLADMGLDADDLYDPTVCALIAGDYMSELLEKYEGDVAAALMAYGGDSSGLKRYFKTGIPSKYAQTILDKSAELERKHGK